MHGLRIKFALEVKIMKQIIFTNWSIMRFLRLGIGIAILAQAVLARDVMFAFLGILFTVMPLFNVGCCGTNGCYVPTQKKSESVKDISYEEVV